MSFKLADLVNIALEEGTYFKSEEWCEKHKSQLLVEHAQDSWNDQFFEAYDNLIEQEATVKNQVDKNHSENFQPLFQFFKKLQNQQPTLEGISVKEFGEIAIQTDKLPPCPHSKIFKTTAK